MAMGGAPPPPKLTNALTRPKNHAPDLNEGVSAKYPLAAKAKIPTITFSVPQPHRQCLTKKARRTQSAGLKPGEENCRDNGVRLCWKLGSQQGASQDYMCDHTAWCVQVMARGIPPAVKLAHIYHIMANYGMGSGCDPSQEARSSVSRTSIPRGVPGRTNSTHQVAMGRR